jgi:hypothetical protein
MKAVPICRPRPLRRAYARWDSPNVFALRAPQDEDEPRPGPSIASNCSQSKNSLCGRRRCPCVALAERVSRYSQITNIAALGTVGLDWQVGRFGNFSSRGTNDISSQCEHRAFEVYNIANNQSSRC